MSPGEHGDSRRCAYAPCRFNGFCAGHPAKAFFDGERVVFVEVPNLAA